MFRQRFVFVRSSNGFGIITQWATLIELFEEPYFGKVELDAFNFLTRLSERERSSKYLTSGKYLAKAGLLPTPVSKIACVWLQN